MRRAAALLLSASLLAPSAAQARELTMGVPTFPYTNQGLFVMYPAMFVSSLPTQAGYMVGQVVCLPISIAQGEVPPEKEASIRCGKAMGTALGWPVYAAVGLPFFLLKQMFWDGPKAVGRMFRAPEEPAAVKE